MKGKLVPQSFTHRLKNLDPLGCDLRTDAIAGK
jgi:hypothetical protein